MSVGTLAPGVLRPASGRRVRRADSLLAEHAAAVVVGLTVLAAVLRFARIGHQGFWFDEANTALLVHFSPGQMLGLIPQSESTPPLYYCVAWVWARVFGYTEAPLRSLSAVAGVAVVPLAYALGAKLATRRVGVVAAALTACNPFLIWYSQEARAYELVVLLTGLTLLACLYAVERPTAGILATWAIVSGLALATEYYALLLVVPEAGWLLLRHGRRRSVQVGIGFVVLCGLALLPLAISQNQTGHASWISPIPLGPRLDQIVPQFLIGFGAPAQRLVTWIAGAIAIIGLLLALLRSDWVEQRAAFVAGAFAVGGLVLNLLLIAGGIDDLITRNVIELWLPAMLAVAAGLGARRAGLLGIGAAVVLCATGIFATVAVAVDRNLQRPDWRGVARVLGSHPPAGSPGRMILVQHYRTLLPLSLYVPGLQFIRGSTRGATVDEFDVISISVPQPPQSLCWWGAACNLMPSQMQSSYPLRGFHLVSVRHVYQFTVMQMASRKPVFVTQQEVARALTTTSLPRDGLLFQP